MIRLAMLCSLLTCSLFAVGCGGGGSGSSDRTAFIQKANAICVKSNEKAGAKILHGYATQEAEQTQYEGEAINLEVTLFMPILLEDAEAQFKGIRALPVPKGDENQVQAILAAYEAWIEKVRATPLQVVIASDIFNDARRWARIYGIDKCARTPYQEPYVHS